MVLVICAPSGAGKTTLAGRILSEFSNLKFSVSCTTRAPRSGEVDGRDYHFISKEEFERRRANHEFIEWAEVHGNYYGTLRKTVEDALACGDDLLFDIDVQGAAQVRLNLPGRCVFVFIAPPSMTALRRRLESRGSDSAETISRRIANARAELANAHWFDFVVINDDLERACLELKSVYLAARISPVRQAGQINKLLAEQVV
ncbi:MAG: guanylate kinase [Desulfovibrionaceae bacterium]|nr:guanylate kinase [Desulfovibrionaceae bacterium]